MASLIELLGSQQVVDELGVMITEKVEVAIAHALGDFELDEPKILTPLKIMIGQAVDQNLPKIKKMITETVSDALADLGSKLMKGETE